MRPDLVIFDCDGVLVDSEPLAIAHLTARLAERGVTLSPEDVQDRFLGRSLTSVREILGEDFGLALSDDDLAAMRAELFAIFRRELRPIDGVAAALDRLSAPSCVASSSAPDRVRLSLELTGLHGYFEKNIFSATMVARGKPAPDLFLFAAERMEAAPNRVVVIEDSPAGLKAARDAGMRALGFVGGGHARAASHADRLRAAGAEAIFEHMSQLVACMDELGT